MNSPLTPVQIAGIKKYAARSRDEIVAVYLYGSMAEGVASPLSDVDLAILLHEPLKRDAFAVEREAYVALGRLFDREVDVRTLTRNTSLPFLEEALGDHVLLAVNDEDYRAEFESQASQRIFDFRPVLTEYFAAMMDRIQKGTYASQ